MSRLDEQRKNAKFVDVVAPFSGWDGDDGHFVIYRFPNDEIGHGRAVEYRNAYNESLRKAVDIPSGDLDLESPDWSKRPDEYQRALRVERYRLNTAGLRYPEAERFVGNDDPMPTDYPHNY